MFLLIKKLYHIVSDNNSYQQHREISNLFSLGLWFICSPHPGIFFHRAKSFQLNEMNPGLLQ